MYARFATFDVPPAQMDAVTEHFRQGAMQAFAPRDGFLGYRSFVDRNKGRMYGISRWASLDALAASSSSGRAIIDGAIKLGAAIVGEPQILEQAFDIGASPANQA